MHAKRKKPQLTKRMEQDREAVGRVVYAADHLSMKSWTKHPDVQDDIAVLRLIAARIHRNMVALSRDEESP